VINGDLMGKFVDLAAMHEQFARTIGVVGADAVSELVRRDVHTIEPHLTVENAGERLCDLGVPFAERLDLAAAEHDARLEGVDDVVVAVRAAVTRDEFVARFVGAVAERRHGGTG
jgi:hypothetical protein